MSKKQKRTNFFLAIIFIISYLITFGLEHYNILRYGSIYNNTRETIGLYAIKTNLELKRYDDAKVQIRRSNAIKYPRYYAKYITISDGFEGIKQEIDTYAVMVDNKEAIVSITYNFTTKDFKYELKDFERPKDKYDYNSHSGKQIKQLSKEEAFSILQKNNLK